MPSTQCAHPASCSAVPPLPSTFPLQARAKELLPLGREGYRAARASLLEAASLLNQFESDVLAAALDGSLTNHAVASLNHQTFQHLSKAAMRWAGLGRGWLG